MSTLYVTALILCILLNNTQIFCVDGRCRCVNLNCPVVTVNFISIVLSESLTPAVQLKGDQDASKIGKVSEDADS